MVPAERAQRWRPAGGRNRSVAHVRLLSAEAGTLLLPNYYCLMNIPTQLSARGPTSTPAHMLVPRPSTAAHSTLPATAWLAAVDTKDALGGRVLQTLLGTN